jgi:type VI secretion system FHA domain protein
MSLILQLEGGEQRPMTGARFTIGRAQENDWVLPDPDQHLSRQHCVIERRGATYCVVDTSSNGVFVNGEATPVGRGSERRLGHGDRLQLGSYVIAVALEGAALAPAPERGKMFDPTHLPKAAPKEGAGRVFDGTWVGSREELGRADHRVTPTGRPDPRFQTSPDHRPVDLGKIVPEAGLFDSGPAPETPAPGAVGEPGLFDSGEEAPAPEASQAAEPGVDPLDPFAVAPAAAPPAAPEPEVAPPPPEVVAPPPVPAPDRRLLEAFLEGAGLGADVLAIEDEEAFMRAAGARLRELTEGLVQLLAARASVKNVARVERTTIGRDLNNPLKYAVTPAEALQAVLEGRGPGFLSPEAAVRGGFRDIQEHEMALLDALQVALRALLQRFEPEGFERQLEAENLFATLVAGGRRAKCWDAFKARYAQIAGEAEREFLGEVGSDFARSYEARTRRM